MAIGLEHRARAGSAVARGAACQGHLAEPGQLAAEHVRRGAQRAIRAAGRQRPAQRRRALGVAQDAHRQLDGQRPGDAAQARSRHRALRGVVLGVSKW